LFDNHLRYLNDLGEENRLILSIEGLHWADTDTLDFLRFFGSNLGAAKKTFIVCTGRTASDRSDLSFPIDSCSRHVILKPADRELWPVYLQGFLGQRDFPESFSEKFYEETGGNFLFAEEIIKEMVLGGFLQRRKGKWFVTEGWEQKIRIPSGITPLINRRLERLNDDQRKLADVAAVLGRAFHEDEILALSGMPGGLNIIESLIDRGVFKRTIFGLDEKVYFVHLQLKRAVDELLPAEESRRWHSRVAEYYREKGEDEEFLGRHYALAGEDTKGFDYLVTAAVNAGRIFSYRQSSDLYKTALRCAMQLPDSTKRKEMLYTVNLGAGKALNYISPPDALEYLNRAASLASEELAENTLASEALIAAGISSLHLGKNETALDLLGNGLSLAEESGEAKLRGEAHVGLGFVYDKMGRLDEANNAYLRALDVFAEIEFPEGSCRVLNYLGITRKRRGDLEGAEDFYRRALSICKEKDFKWSAMNLYGNLGNLYSTKGDYQSAKDHYLLSLGISREISDRRIESVNLLNTGHILNQLGEIDSAEKIFFEALDKQRMLGDKSSEAITLNNLGFLCFRKGEIKNSLDYYEKGLDLSREIDQPRAELANLIGIAEDKSAFADFNDALLMAEKASELAAEIDDTEQKSVVMTIIAEILFELGEIDRTINALKKFFELPADIGEPRQRIKALLLAERLEPEIALDADIQSLIKEIIESEPFLGAVAVRFRAENELRSERSSISPEIWLGRIDDAIRKAERAYLRAEKIRLSAIKIGFLRKTGDVFEMSRLEDRLSEEIARFTMGLDDQLKINFVDYLKLSENKNGKESPKMDKVNREERLEVLFRVARTINTIRESDPLLNKIMDLVIETLMAERGFIMLYISEERSKKENRILEPVVARNFEQEDILGEKSISRSSALEVAETGKPLLLSRTDDDISGRQSVVDFRISSILCVPLAVKGKILGIVYVDSRSGTVFNDDDLDFLSSFADLAAIAIENARLTERLEQKTVYLQKQVESIWDFGNIVGRSSPMQRVFRMAESVADTDVNVVISGESGTGKELLARAIHYAGKRKNSRFQPVDCGAVTETLLESELFGYVKGAFTGAVSDRPGLFEVAHGGAIFLDEITNTSGNFQARLLRVLQENEIRRVGDTRLRPIDVRVIAATNKNLEDEVRDGNFREDLYYRLNVVNINIPPLRERKEDIPILAGYFLEKICARMKIPEKVFSSEAIDKMMLYSWPGNVRQLENVSERAIIFSKSDTIGTGNLPPEIKSAQYSGDQNSALSVPTTKSELKNAKAEMDKIFLMALLRKTNGNVMKAASLSGMDRSQLHHMINKLGLDTTSFKK
ncbi:MAG: sigma 54-interacting transcriptional regulator, partial [candidate division Zixibacteria bacterium]